MVANDDSVNNSFGNAAGATQPGEVLPMLFKGMEALDSNRHPKLSRRARASYRFARGTNAIPIGFAEIIRVSHDFPIVFAGEGENLHMVAVVGLTDEGNLFVNADGRWQGRYVPAYLRGYPFAFARGPEQPEGTYTVVFDPTSEELGNGEGSRLFADDGAQTPFLNKVVEFLQHYDAQTQLSRAFARRISELGLLRSVSADVQMRDGTKHALSGMRVVDRDVLRALPVEARMELFDRDWLEAIYHHLGSLETFTQLVDKLGVRNRKDGRK